MTLDQAIERLRTRQPVPLFVRDQPWDAELDEQLRSARVEELFEGLAVREPRMATCAVAGLHLWNDAFDASHNLCQGIGTPTGAYWHAICHRREGHAGSGLASNLSNARYWFRQVGDHPVYDSVYQTALQLLDATGAGFRWATEAAGQLRERRRWDPSALVDWFAQADSRVLSVQTQSLLEEIQWREIDLLVSWCAEQASGR
jgi:hypothetical protein